MIRAHAKAARDALTAAGIANVHDVGKVPASPVTPYVVLSLDTGRPDDYRTNGGHVSRDFTAAAQYFGKTADEARWAAEKVEAAFLDKRIPVAGRKTTRCRREVSADIDRDPDAGVLMYGVDVYTFTSDPA